VSAHCTMKMYVSFEVKLCMWNMGHFFFVNVVSFCKEIWWNPHLMFLSLWFIITYVQFKWDQVNNVIGKFPPFKFFLSLVFLFIAYQRNRNWGFHCSNCSLCFIMCIVNVCLYQGDGTRQFPSLIVACSSWQEIGASSIPRHTPPWRHWSCSM
jgi:hypothetical protein